MDYDIMAQELWAEIRNQFGRSDPRKPIRSWNLWIDRNEWTEASLVRADYCLEVQ